jgi:hypothetical protein
MKVLRALDYLLLDDLHILPARIPISRKALRHGYFTYASIRSWSQPMDVACITYRLCLIITGVELAKVSLNYSLFSFLTVSWL